MLCQIGVGYVAGRGSAAPPSKDQVPVVRGDGDGGEEEGNDSEKDQASSDGGDGDGDEDADDDFETTKEKPQKRKKSNEKSAPTASCPPSKKLSVGERVKAAPEPG